MHFSNGSIKHFIGQSKTLGKATFIHRVKPLHRFTTVRLFNISLKMVMHCI